MRKSWYTKSRIFIGFGYQYSEVCFDGLKLSVSDIIVSQKGSNGDEKLQFSGRDYNFTCTLCAKLHLWAKVLSAL